MIELGKEYKTRDGRQVVILATNGRGPCPVVGQILNENGEWEYNSWTADGFYYTSRSYSISDLIEVKPVRVFERWVNVHTGGVYTWHQTPLHAFNHAADRIACLHIRHEYQEGEGL
jgi:hypothetical protein